MYDKTNHSNDIAIVFRKKTYDMVFQIRAEIWIFKIYIYIIVNTQEKK